MMFRKEASCPGREIALTNAKKARVPILIIELPELQVNLDNAILIYQKKASLLNFKLTLL